MYNKPLTRIDKAYYRQAMRPTLIPGLSNQLDFFELLRRIDKVNYKRCNVGHHDLFGCLRVIQPADMSFAPREVADVQQEIDQSTQQPRIVVTARHFGMFAPYGPLPVHMTDHARQEMMVHGNRAFQEFISILSQRFSILQYRAWSQLHVALGHEKPKYNAFLRHLEQLSGVSNLECGCAESRQLRPLFAGAWLPERNNLSSLEKILRHYFRVPVSIIPRHARWFEDKRNNVQQRLGFLGKTRIGKRFFDAQNSAKICIGPLNNPDHLAFLHDGNSLAALMRVCNDFVSHQIIFSVDLLINVIPEMTGKTGKMVLGKSAWLRAGKAIYCKALY